MGRARHIHSLVLALSLGVAHAAPAQSSNATWQATPASILKSTLRSVVAGAGQVPRNAPGLRWLGGGTAVNPGPDVKVQIVGVTSSGWRAKATHKARPGRSCVVFVGKLSGNRVPSNRWRTARWLERREYRSVTGWSKTGPVVGPKHAARPSLRPHGLISHAWRWGAGVISAGAGLVSILSYTHSMKAKFDPDSVAVGGDDGGAVGGRHAGSGHRELARRHDQPGGYRDGSPRQCLAGGADGVEHHRFDRGLGGQRWNRRGPERGNRRDHGDGRPEDGVPRTWWCGKHPAEVRIVGDSICRVPEGERGQAVAYVADARRQKILGLAVRWRSADPSVAAVDSVGQRDGSRAGHGRRSPRPVRGHGHAAAGRGVSGACVADAARWRRAACPGGTAGAEPGRGTGGVAQWPADRRCAGPVRSAGRRGRRPIPSPAPRTRKGLFARPGRWAGVPGRQTLASQRRRSGEPHGDYRRSRAGRCQHPAGAGERKSRGTGRRTAD